MKDFMPTGLFCLVIIVAFFAASFVAHRVPSEPMAEIRAIVNNLESINNARIDKFRNVELEKVVKKIFDTCCADARSGAKFSEPFMNNFLPADIYASHALRMRATKILAETLKSRGFPVKEYGDEGNPYFVILFN
jgi:hypothetical protein